MEGGNEMHFARTFLINLDFKTDRLAAFNKAKPDCLGEVEVVRAIHGDTVQHPTWWTAGRGAWGCYRSHLRILEECYNRKLESYLVFEDDAIFRPEFPELIDEFLADLPVDWEMIYLGGQLLHTSNHPPRLIAGQVYEPYNVNRTHCFAVHQRGYAKLYSHLTGPIADGHHIDHHLGVLHESGRLKVYCPGRWLVGQDGGPSNISGNYNAPTFYPDPEVLAGSGKVWEHRKPPAVFLEADVETARELERRGWHQGYWKSGNGLDQGVCNAICSLDVRKGLAGWYRAVSAEAASESKACVCLYHPTLTWEMLTSMDFASFHRVTAHSVEDAEAQLAAIATEISTRPHTPRNLIYHIWPRNSSVWKWNVEQLVAELDQFDGVRSIAIVTDDSTDSVEDVKAAFEGHRIDNWIISPNNPNLGEVVSFPKLLETVETAPGWTFYGHAKGTRYDDPFKVRDWTSMMYEVCLRHPSLIANFLEQYPMAGPFYSTRAWEGVPWHFSGSFFWFRNQDVFADPQKAKTIGMQSYWGVEVWPGQMFPADQAGALFGANCDWLYKPGEVARWKAELMNWIAKQAR